LSSNSMRYLVGLVCLCVAANALTISPGENKFTISRPEGTRTFFGYVPKGYNLTNPSQPPVPLHLSFHGLGDYCQDFGHDTGLIDFAENNTFLFVYPCGSDGLIGTAWNAGTCCMQPIQVDDVGFARDIVTFMQKNFKVLAGHVYSSGFSNGAMMSERLACEASDVFVSTASVSGVVELEPGNSQGLELCSTEVAKVGTRASTINIHGNLDFTVPWDGDVFLGFPDIPTNFAYWANRTECSGSWVQTYNKGVYTNQVYQACKDNTQIELMKVDGGGHHWPRDKNFDASAYIVEFFARTSRV